MPNDLVSYLVQSDSTFVTENYDKAFTERQRGSGESWSVARRDEIEVSVRSHEQGFTDICIYDHSGGEQRAIGDVTVQVVSNWLDDRDIVYELLR